MLFKKLVDYIYNIKEFEIENIDNILTNQQHLQGQINANRRAIQQSIKRLTDGTVAPLVYKILIN